MSIKGIVIFLGSLTHAGLLNNTAFVRRDR